MNNFPNIVDLVLYFLGGLSVLTWTILILKSIIFLRLRSSNKHVVNVIKSTSNLNRLHEAIQKKSISTLSNLVGRAVLELRNFARDTGRDIQTLAEALKQSLREERHLQQVRLESGLSVLASIGSTSPFIGLFGTVWGIMNALKGISASGSAGLDVVAGPIGEALIATAMGIATAIPAVLAYNYFLRQTRLAAADMDHFSERLQLLAKHSNYKLD
jgi:biopolymer transport protein ExbB